ncbi:MAG TPA: 50S ribosomal protein L24 [Candidatus Omnitrophica bacterium]|nr:50S ribosomal protein L24 [Candidatus Omnitrophota bacterium]
MLRIKKDDIVYVVSGKDKGKTGKVVKVDTSNYRVLVEGINRVKKHTRKKREDQKTGIIEIEALIHISNLALYCKGCSKPTRTGVLIQQDTSKPKADNEAQDTIMHKQNKTRLRICKRCKEAI